MVLMTSSEEEGQLLLYIQLFQSESIFVLNVSAKFELDQIKTEEAAAILL